MDNELHIQETQAQIEALKKQHRMLDALIADHITAGDIDEIALVRLKKRKLLLKDALHALECSLTPDIPA
jgi:hypothetical protein